MGQRGCGQSLQRTVAVSIKDRQKRKFGAAGSVRHPGGSGGPATRRLSLGALFTFTGSFKLLFGTMLRLRLVCSITKSPLIRQSDNL